MKSRRRSVACLVVGGVFGLVVIVASGGALLALVEGVDYLSGVRLAFSTVSTTGFGTGPQTTMGTFGVLGTFIAGAGCWFVILVACFQLGVRRYYESVGDPVLGGLVEDPWLSPIVPKGRG